VSTDNASGPRRFPRGPRAVLSAIALVAVIAAGGGTYLGLRGDHSHKSVSETSGSAETTTTLAPPVVTTGPTTPPAPTPTTTPAQPAATKPAATKQALPDTSKPVAVAGGSFVVVSGEVTLTHVVARCDTLYGIAQWFKLMGGVTALYEWNHSTVGSNPNLIFPGQVLAIKVPGADIPTISPMYLADTQQAAKTPV
jgi:nucleoid-associated protein YgaU